jgi:LCP family protein required for cell wall assembly
MSDTPGLENQAESWEIVGEGRRTGAPARHRAVPPGRDDIAPGRGGRRRRRRGRRIALICLATVVTLIVAVAVGGYATVNHVAGQVQRIPNVFAGLDAATRPVMPAATQKSMTILFTGSYTQPVTRGGGGPLKSSTASQDPSGLIALVHFDANGKAGAIVSIPGNTEVAVPGHGTTELESALVLGGPSLLIRTVEKLTNVRIDHYTVIDFAGVVGALRPLGGVDVYLPAATSSNGVVFHAGLNHVTSSNALDYVRQTSLSEEGRVLRQQALLRAVVDKFAALDLLSNPLRDLSLLDAFTAALRVDSDFTNSGLESLAGQLHLLRPGTSTFVTAPVVAAAPNSTPVRLNAVVSGKLWQAIRNDKVAAFAKQYPATLTPYAPS